MTDIASFAHHESEQVADSIPPPSAKQPQNIAFSLLLAVAAKTLQLAN